MNILMVIGQYRPIVGGSEVQAERIAEGLVAQGHHVTVITSRPKQTPLLEEQGNLTIKRLDVPGFGKLKIYLLMSAMLFEILRSVRKFDVVHVHQALYPAFAAALATRWLRKPMIVKIANSGAGFDLHKLVQSFWWGRFMAHFVAKRVNCFVAVNRNILEDLEEWKVPPERAELIPNTVTLHQARWNQPVEGYRQQLKLPFDRTILLCVASLLPKKNHMVLLDAVKRLRASGAPLHLVLLGEGSGRGTLSAWVQKNGMQDVVEFRGVVPNVVEYMYASDIFVLPSLFEGISNALLEAMSVGLPCIVSDAPGNWEVVVEGQNGLRFAPHDAEALARCIEEVRTDALFAGKLGIAARMHVERYYSLESGVQRYLKLYQRLL